MDTYVHRSIPGKRCRLNTDMQPAYKLSAAHCTDLPAQPRTVLKDISSCAAVLKVDQ